VRAVEAPIGGDDLLQDRHRELGVRLPLFEHGGFGRHHAELELFVSAAAPERGARDVEPDAGLLRALELRARHERQKPRCADGDRIGARAEREGRRLPQDRERARIVAEALELAARGEERLGRGRSVVDRAREGDGLGGAGFGLLRPSR